MNEETPVKVQVTHLFWKEPGKLVKSKTRVDYEYVVDLSVEQQKAVLERGVRHITINHYKGG